MSKIAFFCIPAFGHTNPTLEVVRHLVAQGHIVWYYSYEQFREKIALTGAQFIPCDSYDNQMDLKPEDAARVSDIGFATKLLVNTTLAMDDALYEQLLQFAPDVVVADSMALWGKLLAKKLKVPFVSSTTTFAFNKESAKIMKQDAGQLFALIKAMPGVNRDLKRLRQKGYPVKNILSVIANDNDTNTVVYTSRLFQPAADSFSDKYTFVGPSIRKTPPPKEKNGKRVYISLGTVNNQNSDFYKNCIEALKNTDYEVTMSVGQLTDIAALGSIPQNVTVAQTVNQIEMLRAADVFLTHCGMNSTSESLYFSVPLVLFPQTAEQGGVARRTAQLGAGLMLQESTPKAIAAAIKEVLAQKSYQQNAAKIAESFHAAGGAPLAAAAILKAAENQ